MKKFIAFLCALSMAAGIVCSPTAGTAVSAAEYEKITGTGGDSLSGVSDQIQNGGETDPEDTGDPQAGQEADPNGSGASTGDAAGTDTGALPAGNTVISGEDADGQTAETDETADGYNYEPEEILDGIPETEEPDIEFPEMIAEAREALKAILAQHDIMAVVYLSDEYIVRSAPSADSAAVATVPSGYSVFIKDVTLDDSYQAWEYVFFYLDGAEYCGFVERANIACADEDFLNWELEYGMNTEANKPMTVANSAANGYTEDVLAFPASYQADLATMKKAHPNWTFAVLNTGLNWNDVINNELKGDTNLVSGSFKSYKRNELCGQSWYYPTREILEYYIDPRPWLRDRNIFMFEQLTYNPSCHNNVPAVQTFLNSTFMSGTIPGTSKTYAQAFVEIGSTQGVSPFHIASRLYQEQGSGNSKMISGNFPGYVGYYNYFNIGAPTRKTDDEVVRVGLQYAKKMGWDTRYKSIEGGVAAISANYIKKQQDTLYLQKYNVVGKGYYSLYTHQYMQNVSAPHSEAITIGKMYEAAGAQNSPFVFKIPVYNNMPASACPEPTHNYSVKVTKPSGYSDSTIYLDGVAYQGVSQNGLLVTAPNANAKTAVMYRYNSSGIPVGMYVWLLNYNTSSQCYTVTAMPNLQDLLTYHGFQIRITGNSGIRFLTGISSNVRAKLISSSGVSGYRLKEYGTIVLPKSYTSKYPLVKSSPQVASSVAYGTSNGQHVNVALKMVSGRYWYTSVLVNLAPEQYKMDFAFRGYIILTKGGQDYIVYGPQMAKNIYAMANDLINQGYYARGSSEDAFLRKIISNAK